jgi:hypothetical protein
MNFLFFSILALLFGFKYAAAQAIVQPAAAGTQNVFNGIGVQVFVTGLTPSTNHTITLQSTALNSATVFSSTNVLSSITGTAFAILPVPFNVQVGGTPFVAIYSTLAPTIVVDSNAVVMNALTLPLFPPITSGSGDSYQLEQTISLPFLLNKAIAPTEGCFGYASSNASAVAPSECFSATFSQNASAYVGTGSSDTLLVAGNPHYVFLGFSTVGTVFAQTVYSSYAQPAVQSSRIPRSLLPKVLP